MQGVRRILMPAVVIFGALAVSGCVRRTIRITTEPPDARVFLNDQDVGRSPVHTDFLWYGDYDVAVRAEGYQTLQTNWKIEPPWYQIVPLDFFAEVLWPGQLHDRHDRHFVLQPADAPDRDALLDRAESLREEAVGIQP